MIVSREPLSRPSNLAKKDHSQKVEAYWSSMISIGSGRMNTLEIPYPVRVHVEQLGNTRGNHANHVSVYFFSRWPYALVA